MKLWGSRMVKPTDELVARLNASLPFDVRLWREDVEGSLAWAEELLAAGVLTEAEHAQVGSGLRQILAEFESGRFETAPDDEDIHTGVERRLTELIGPAAGKLHTGRSRNDQVATDFRLWILRACDRLGVHLADLAGALGNSAEAHLATPMPGYTHLQPAQPVTWGHWALSHGWALLRDRSRLVHARRAAGILPLGSGALAGTTVNVDRARLAERLGFAGITPNSIDAVADRDFALDFLYACAVAGVHLSRLSEALILFSSAEFGFVELDDAYATGSSLMPQKKNPDPLELARGKAGRLIGGLTGLLATLKGLPSAYDKDLQEDKQPAFDAYDTLDLLLPVLAGLVRTLRLKPDRMAAAVPSEAFAVDLADYLVGRGVPFRAAHDLGGRAVRRALETGVPLGELPISELQAISALFQPDVAGVFDLHTALERRDSPGGTSGRSLGVQLAAFRDALATR